jgi:hypothetical protein
MEDRLVLPTELYPVAFRDAPEQLPDQLKFLTNIVHQLATAHVDTPSIEGAPTKHTTSVNPTADFERAAGGRREHDAIQVDSNGNPLEYIVNIDPRE